MARRAIYSNWVRSIQHLKGILRSFIPLFSFLLASFFLSSSLYSVYCSIYSCIKSGGFLLPLQLIPSFSSPSFLPLFSLVFFSHPCSSSSLFSFISFLSSFLCFFCLSLISHHFIPNSWVVVVYTSSLHPLILSRKNSPA